MWGIDQAWSHWVVARKCGYPPFVPRWAGWIPYPGHYYALSRLLILAFATSLAISCPLSTLKVPFGCLLFREFVLNHSTKMRKNPAVKLQDCSSY
jgi:hypothetical protein